MKNAFNIDDMVHRLLVGRLADIVDIGLEHVIPKLAGISRLAAGLRIEAGLRKDDIALIFQFIDGHTILEQADDRTFTG